jgi:hypothetical protein
LLESVRIGAQRPQVEHLPPAAVTSAGREAIDLAASAGLILDDWQQHVLLHALGEKDDGKWSAFEVGLVVPRQNGKGSILEALELAALFLFDERLVIHSAHEVPTAMEHFLRLQTLIEGSPDLSRKVAAITVANGKEGIRLRSGARLKIKARSKGGARGFTGDRIVLDEAYDLPPKAIGAMIPTLSARPNPQVWYVSSAPHSDSVILHGLRSRAMSPETQRLAYFEWCNEPDVDPDDVDSWYQSNPALGIRISEQFVADELRAMSSAPEQFMVERLGVPEPLDGQDPGLALDAWHHLSDVHSTISTGHRFALDVSPARTRSSIGVGGLRADGVYHAEVVDSRDGTGWVFDRAVELWQRHQAAFVIDPGSAAGTFIVPLRDAGVEVIEATTRSLVQACGLVDDAVSNGRLRHIDQRELNDAVKGAARRPVGDAWAWSRRSAKLDITPLVAITLALGAVPLTSSDFFIY